MKLSIIIPIYNIPTNKLKRVYNSLKDIGIDYDVLFINDGSTDDSLERLKNLFSSEERVKILSQENQGLSGARNTGIKNATGEYLVFLDADDYINTKFLEKLLKDTIQEDLDLLGFKIQFVNETFSPIGVMNCHTITTDVINSGKFFLVEGFQPSSACQFIYKKSFLEKENLFFYPKIYHEDVEFTTRLLLKAKRVKFTNEIIYNYVQADGSMSKPTSTDKLHKLLYDEILVAELIKQNIGCQYSKRVNFSIEKNYNSITWNLLWRFYKNPNEVDINFKQKCIHDLKEKGLYPINGGLKTPFQKFTRILMNNSLFLNKFILKK